METLNQSWIQSDTTVSNLEPGDRDHPHHDPASTQITPVAGYSNETQNEITSNLVFYYGLNGFGITWIYFLTNIVLLVIAGIGIFLNAVAMKTVSTKPPLHDASHNFISHLALSDIIISVFCIYNAVYNLIHYKNYYECTLRCGIATCFALNSSIHLLFLTFDRHFKIMHPYKYYQYLGKERRLKSISRFTWLFSGILGILPILGWRRPPVYGIEYCSYFGVLDRGYLMLTFTLFFGIMVVMFYCYISILCVAWNQRRRVIRSPIASDKRSSYDHRNTKVLWWAPTKTIMILITLYCCCWMPTAVVVLLHLTDMFPPSYTDDQKGVIVTYATALVYLNIVANPLIYAFKIRRRKQSMRRCAMIQSITPEALPRRVTSLDPGHKDAFELSEVLKATLNQ